MAAIFETLSGSYFSPASTAPISLNGETSNSPKLFTKLTIKFHIWNHKWGLTTAVVNVIIWKKIVSYAQKALTTAAVTQRLYQSVIGSFI